MKKFVYILSISFLFFSCKDDSNPIKTEPPNPYVQKEIDWPSLQKAPWPMYRHDPQLTGRSQYVGPTKGIIVDTVKLWSYASAVINNAENAYLSFSFDTSGDICSYSLKNKLINWKLRLPINYVENPNTPAILPNGNVLFIGKRLFLISENGSLLWEFSTGQNTLLSPTTQIDKEGNIYTIES